MDWSEKIENKKYIGGTLVSVVIATTLTKAETRDAIVLVGVILCSALNQWLMFLILGKLLKQMTEESVRPNLITRAKLWLQVALKFSLLGGVFYYLISYSRHLVAHGLILYTFQLIILVLSIKNIGAFIKKGSSE
jgi:hypothetical protein